MTESIRKSQEEMEILELCERVISPLGFRPVDLDFRLAGRSLIRLFIERMKAEAITETSPGVSVENCAEVSRALGPALDERVPGGYDLEVSSPGLDRRLRLKTDFQMAVGQEVKLRLAEKLPGRGANLTGILVKVDDDQVFVAVGKEEVPVPLGIVLQAVRVWQAHP